MNQYEIFLILYINRYCGYVNSIDIINVMPYNITDFQGMILLINLTKLKNEIWNDKIIVSIKLTNKQNAIETINKGIQKGDKLYIVPKKV